jgi:hypothetical protein
VDARGDSIDFDCRIRIDLGICTQIIDISGSGTLTETSLDLNSVLMTYLEPAEGVSDSTCQYFYGNFIDECTTLISSTGVWLSADGADTCPGGMVSLESVLTQVARRRSR